MKIYLEGGPAHGKEIDCDAFGDFSAPGSRSAAVYFDGNRYEFTGRSLAGLRVFRWTTTE